MVVHSVTGSKEKACTSQKDAVCVRVRVVCVEFWKYAFQECVSAYGLCRSDTLSVHHYYVQFAFYGLGWILSDFFSCHIVTCSARMTAGILKQDPNTDNVEKNSIYYDKTQHANVQGRPFFKLLCNAWTTVKWWKLNVEYLTAFGWSRHVKGTKECCLLGQSTICKCLEYKATKRHLHSG